MRNNRIIYMTKMLCDSPNKIFSLKEFCEKFGAAKSSISEDLKIIKQTIEDEELGFIETIPGASGGVRFIPYAGDEQCIAAIEDFCTHISDPHRMLGGGFIYSSDIMFNPDIIEKLAVIFARKFKDLDADYIATIETKGIGLATLTARLLNVPVVVIRREAKVSEGPTLSINYFSGSSDRIQKMSISKKAVTPGSRIIIIDDFMRAGGSIQGISEIMEEFA